MSEQLYTQEELEQILASDDRILEWGPAGLLAWFVKRPQQPHFIGDIYNSSASTNCDTDRYLQTLVMRGFISRLDTFHYELNRRDPQ